MKFFPSEDYTLITELPIEEVIERLKLNVGTRGFKFEAKPYQGYIMSNSFEIDRVLEYRNSFKPIIKGEMQKNPKGTTIHIRMKTQSFANAFMTLWFGVIGFVNVEMLYLVIFCGKIHPAMLVPIAMFAFAYFIVYVLFKSESSSSRRFIARMFEGEEIGSN